ncbi:homospermidine synthase [Novispirillum itersonii]|uniref:homospermidine synthase n=1 Tax=Novispirillum itersonii TaxID=189 RepID=UPI000364A081|nr:saccharopine dehydrogenase C-terminal domain-containing protein [Novispirillum itersonii]
MSEWKRLVRFGGPIVIIGFGSIGQGVLPLILRHIDAPREAITIIAPDDTGRGIADAEGIRFLQTALTPETARAVLEPLLAGQNGFIVNMSVNVSSLDLIRLAQEWGALYIDTCIEPWEGGYTDTSKTASQRSNYALREEALALQAQFPGGKTAVMAHGANPGLVSHFVKRALLTVAADTGVAVSAPSSRAEWAQLARTLGIKGIHIAERDTQTTVTPKVRGEFWNTWSIDGFVGEGMQPAELGWGTHEKGLPEDGFRHGFGCDAAIYLGRPGASTRVRTWTPMEGPFHGFLITHNEAISIADYLTVRDGDAVVYRPTVHYAYHPCDAAVLSLHELSGKEWSEQPVYRLLNEQLTEGRDELGVLLFGHAKNAYWYGSHLSVAEARELAPYQNATGLQVTAAVLGGMVWAINNPDAGLMEADELPHEDILAVAAPYLGPVVGEYTDWTPLQGREKLFPEDVDHDDPWQFRNVRVR